MLFRKYFVYWVGLVLHLFISIIVPQKIVYERELHPDALLLLTAQHIQDVMLDLDVEIRKQLEYYDKLDSKLRQGSNIMSPQLRNIFNDTEMSQLRRKRSISMDTNGPSELKILTVMEEDKMGYCHKAAKGVIYTIIVRTDDDLKKLIYAFETTILRMTNDGKLTRLGKLLTRQMKLLSFRISVLPIKKLRAYVRRSRPAFDDKHFLYNEMLATYDTFFTVQEGETLLSNIVQLYDHDIEDTAGIETIIERIIDVIIAPANRHRGLLELTYLLAKIYKVWFGVFPDFKRSDIYASGYTLAYNDIEV